MNFELILGSINMIISLILIILFIVILLKDKKWWGLLIILFIGFCGYLLNEFESWFEDFLNEGFNGVSWQIIGLFFALIVISMIIDISIKADALCKDKLQKKKYINEQIKNVLILILGGLLILGIIVGICSIK
mgnify:FL=1